MLRGMPRTVESVILKILCQLSEERVIFFLVGIMNVRLSDEQTFE